MSDTPALVFDRLRPVTFAIDREARTVTGLAVPFGDVGDNGFGRYRFSKGSLTWGKVKFLRDHAWSNAIGLVELTETDEGLVMAASIRPTASGDEYLALATPDADGNAVYDGLSIGLDFAAKFEEAEDGVFDCVSGVVQEVSGTPIPAFENAQVRSVVASRATHNRKESAVMDDENTNEPDAFSKADGEKLSADVAQLATKLAELGDVK